MTTLFIDADKLVYSCAFACQKKKWFAEKNGQLWFEGNKRSTDKFVSEQPDPENFTVDYFQEVEPVANCIYNINHTINSLLDTVNPDRYVVLLSEGRTTFRDKLATIQKYKGNRDKLEKPIYYQEARRHLIRMYGAKVYQKWEADDAAVMAMYLADQKGRDAVLAHVDKDLMQIPGKHINIDKLKDGIFEVDEIAAWQSFYIQMLMGDNSDNIPGLRGVGEVFASATVAPCHSPEEMCDLVWQMYKVHYPATAVAYRMFRENADLLYMLRTPDDQYYPHCKELQRIWTPYPEGVVNHYLKIQGLYK